MQHAGAFLLCDQGMPPGPLQDVAFEGGTWHGEELRDRAVAVDVSWPFHSAPGRVFAQPEVRFWLSPRGPGNVSEPIWDILLYGSTFLDDDTDLRYIQYVRPPQPRLSVFAGPVGIKHLS